MLFVLEQRFEARDILGLDEVRQLVVWHIDSLRLRAGAQHSLSPVNADGRAVMEGAWRNGLTNQCSKLLTF